jgi:hypothetical protein
MSETPRVDKWAFDAMPGGPEVVSANCARELEEFLKAAEDENEVLHKEIERLDEMVMRWFKAASPYATPGSLEAALRRFHHWEGEMVRLLGIDPKDAGSLPDDVRSRKTDAGHPHRE